MSSAPSAPPTPTYETLQKTKRKGLLSYAQSYNVAVGANDKRNAIIEAICMAKGIAHPNDPDVMPQLHTQPAPATPKTRNGKILPMGYSPDAVEGSPTPVRPVRNTRRSAALRKATAAPDSAIVPAPPSLPKPTTAPSPDVAPEASAAPRPLPPVGRAALRNLNTRRPVPNEDRVEPDIHGRTANLPSPSCSPGPNRQPQPATEESLRDTIEMIRLQMEKVDAMKELAQRKAAEAAKLRKLASELKVLSEIEEARTRRCVEYLTYWQRIPEKWELFEIFPEKSATIRLSRERVEVDATDEARDPILVKFRRCADMLEFHVKDAPPDETPEALRERLDRIEEITQQRTEEVINAEIEAKRKAEEEFATAQLKAAIDIDLPRSQRRQFPGGIPDEVLETIGRVDVSNKGKKRQRNDYDFEDSGRGIRLAGWGMDEIMAEPSYQEPDIDPAFSDDHRRKIQRVESMDPSAAAGSSSSAYPVFTQPDSQAFEPYDAPNSTETQVASIPESSGAQTNPVDPGTPSQSSNEMNSDATARRRSPSPPASLGPTNWLHAPRPKWTPKSVPAPIDIDDQGN